MSRSKNPSSRRPATLWVRIRYFKTNQFKAKAHVIPLPATGDEVCPMNALKVHLAETPGGPKDNLFRIPDKRGKLTSLTHKNLVKGIKELVRAAGKDPTQFSGHSLRRGGGTLAFRLGAPVHQIQLQGMWRSDAVLDYHQVSSTDRLELPIRMAAAVRMARLGVRTGSRAAS